MLFIAQFQLSSSNKLPAIPAYIVFDRVFYDGQNRNKQIFPVRDSVCKIIFPQVYVDGVLIIIS